MSLLFSKDVRSGSLSANTAFGSKFKDFVENIYEAGLSLHNTVSQLKRFRKTWGGKLTKLNTMGSSGQVPYTSES